MSDSDITPREALLRLGASTAEAIAQVLETFAPGQIERGDVSVIADNASPFTSLVAGTVAASVSYVDGVTGANVFVLHPVGARKLAQAMGVPPEEQDAEEAPPPLSELELSAISEASNQMMAAAASAIGMVLGQEIEISPPDTRVLDDPAAATELYGTSPHACSTTFMICGESCRLIQLIPSAFVVRVARALDELGGDSGGEEIRPRTTATDSSVALTEALGGIRLRVWAELGRTRLPLGRALGLPLGAVVELDRAADAPIDLFVNGVCFATGQLLISDDGEWALRLDDVGGRRVIPSPAALPLAADLRAASADNPEPHKGAVT